MIKFLANSNIDPSIALTEVIDLGNKRDRFIDLLAKPLSAAYKYPTKLNQLLELGAKETNYLVFQFLKSTAYPLAHEYDFPLLEDEDNLVRKDIFRLLEESGVGVPAYYNKKQFEVNGNFGEYARSRSGCFFCFFQQKIEWVWLYEQHPELYMKAMEYEKEGYTWGQEESLEELIKPQRIQQIKSDYIKKQSKDKKPGSYLVDILDDEENIGCAACFI